MYLFQFVLDQIYFVELSLESAESHLILHIECPGLRGICNYRLELYFHFCSFFLTFGSYSQLNPIHTLQLLRSCQRIRQIIRPFVICHNTVVSLLRRGAVIPRPTPSRLMTTPRESSATASLSHLQLPSTSGSSQLDPLNVSLN
jgi:hypothetical protein